MNMSALDGASGCVALDAEQKFFRINRRCHAFSDNHIQKAMAAPLGPGDVAIGISHSGFTKDIVSALSIAHIEYDRVTSRRTR